MWAPMMGWNWGEGAGWWMITMVIANVAFWGGLVALCVWALGHFTGSARGEHHDPVAIARERLARGEITREQYEEIRTTLATR